MIDDILAAHVLVPVPDLISQPRSLPTMGLPCALSRPPVAPFLFSLLVVSGLSSKLLHIAQHVRSLPLLYFIIYLPTLFFLDLFVICLGRLLLRGTETPFQLLTCILGGLMA